MYYFYVAFWVSGFLWSTERSIVYAHYDKGCLWFDMEEINDGDEAVEKRGMK